MEQIQKEKDALNKLRESANKTKNDVNYTSIVTGLDNQNLPEDVSKLIGGLLDSNDKFHQIILMLIAKHEQGLDVLANTQDLLKTTLSLNSELITRLNDRIS